MKVTLRQRTAPLALSGEWIRGCVKKTRQIKSLELRV
jgi:hypothetical protein